MRNRLLGIGIAVASLGVVACDSTGDVAGPDELAAVSATDAVTEINALDGRADLPTIADIAETNPNFSILYAALEAAGLTDTFDGRRQYTVFAPTDDAFVALLGDLGLTAEELLADTDLLTAVLLYHVTPGNRNSTAVVNSGQVRMLNGQFAPVTVDGGAPFIDGAPILDTDIRASNGTIHVIESVLLP